MILKFHNVPKQLYPSTNCIIATDTFAVQWPKIARSQRWALTNWLALKDKRPDYTIEEKYTGIESTIDAMW